MDNTSSSTPREIIFETELPFEEDIVAELENFILYGRLGLVDEALEILENVLWKHLKQFPVFAEAAAFLVEHDQYARLQELMKHVGTPDFELLSRRKCLSLSFCLL